LNKHLLKLFTALENSADSTGCAGDLTVVSQSALEAVAEWVGTKPPSEYVLASGNPFDGLFIHGPFDDAAEATEYAENHYKDSSWWVVKLNPADL